MPDMSLPPAFCYLPRLFRYKLLTVEAISNFWGVHWVHIRASEKYWNLPCLVLCRGPTALYFRKSSASPNWHRQDCKNNYSKWDSQDRRNNYSKYLDIHTIQKFLFRSEIVERENIPNKHRPHLMSYWIMNKVNIIRPKL